MNRQSILMFIKQIKRQVFTTNELSNLSGKSLSVTTQSLNNLRRNGAIIKIYRGVWAEVRNEPLSPYSVITAMFHIQRAYVSFISALHLYGIIEQIPQSITLASTSHTRIIKTAIGVYYIHHIDPAFFSGFNWYKGTGDFLIAEPEKALVDSLYLSACKKRQFGYFPELHIPETFSFKKVEYWIRRIPNLRIRANVNKKLGSLLPKLA